MLNKAWEGQRCGAGQPLSRYCQWHHFIPYFRGDRKDGEGKGGFPKRGLTTFGFVKCLSGLEIRECDDEWGFLVKTLPKPGR